MFHIQIDGVFQKYPAQRDWAEMAPLAFFSNEEEAQTALTRAVAAVASWAAIDPDTERATQAVERSRRGQVVPCKGGYREQGLFGPRCDCKG